MKQHDVRLPDHQNLNGVLKQVQDASDLQRLHPLLTNLQELLERHFFAEEDHDGLFDAIESKAPRLCMKVEECRQDHRELQGFLDQLINQAVAMQCDTKRFLQQLRDHEAKETELLNDSMYLDLGGSD